MDSPLTGTTVLSMAEQYPGPYATLLLADLGADVILLERPGTGDPSRFAADHFNALNRNKRSITVDLRTEKGKEICFKLAKRSDVFMEGFRPGVVKRLGVDYESLRKVNPNIIYCSISGYGQDGPYRDWPAHDLTYQGMAGLLSNLIPSGNFSGSPGVAIGDLSSGMFATIGVLTALVARGSFGTGQYIDVSMRDGLLSWMSVPLATQLRGARRTAEGAGGEPAYGVFATGDGKYLTLSIAHEDHFWRNLSHTIGREDLAEIPRASRHERRDELRAVLAEVLLTRPRDEWVKLLIAADVPCGPVYSLEEVGTDSQVIHRGMITEISLPSREKVRQVAHPLKFSETPSEVRRPAPKLGENTNEILQSLGYTKDEIEELRKEQAI
jgi:crotonobetainyl-CoA:carnitine CoA-transferase CaiB-like acyl-CoA transferase